MREVDEMGGRQVVNYGSCESATNGHECGIFDGILYFLPKTDRQSLMLSYLKYYGIRV